MSEGVKTPDAQIELLPHRLPNPWGVRAPDLAEWAEVHLVNRTDAWGGYHTGGQFTNRGQLKRGRIVRHFQGRATSDIIGLHTADADNLSLGGAIDIDQHGNDPVKAGANVLAAAHWFAVLRFGGFHPLLTGSNGAGGYHLRLLLREKIDAARVYHFLRWLTSDHRKVGLDKAPEQFPKQADVRRCAKGLGNWIRIFGRHHKRAYWSQVWDGMGWLEGDDAIDYILALPGDDPGLVPDVPPTPPPPSPRRQQPSSLGRSDNISNRIAAYMRRLPHGTVGTGRDDVAYNFACWLVRDLALPDHVALPWLAAWDSGNSPPKGRERLTEILKNARLYGQKPMGSGNADSTTRGGAA
jgi:hypothetical protein